MNESFGPGYMSVNKENGGKYTDSVIGNLAPGYEEQLNAYLNKISAPQMTGYDSYRAYGQLYGEYGVYGNVMAKNAAYKFGKLLDGQLSGLQASNILQDTLGSAGVRSPAAYASYGGGRREGYGPGYSRGRIWGGGFGDWSEQDGKNNIHGYDYDAGGLVLGYDRKFGSLNMGIAAAYTGGSLKVKDLATKFEGDMMNIGVYAGYMSDAGFFANAKLGYGYGWNDYKVNLIPGGVKRGDYHNQTYSAAAEIGYAFRLPMHINLIPSLGIAYTHLRQGSWREKGFPVANWFEKQNDNWVGIPLEVKVSKVIPLGPGKYIAPEVRVGWTYEAKEAKSRIRTGYLGSNSSVQMVGVDPGRSRLVVGAGVKARLSGRVDLGVDYTFESRSRYSSHNVAANIGLSF